MIELNLHPTERQLRQFAALVLPLVACLVAGLLVGRWQLVGPALAVSAVTLLLAVAGLLRPALLRPIYALWMIAAYPLGWVMGHVMIAAVFFLVLTPLGLLLRLLGRDALSREFEPQRESYWEPREQVEDPARTSGSSDVPCGRIDSLQQREPPDEREVFPSRTGWQRTRRP